VVGGRCTDGMHASSQGDKCQPWCMQIKPRQQAVKGVRTPFDPIAWEGTGRAVCKKPVYVCHREKACVLRGRPVYNPLLGAVESGPVSEITCECNSQLARSQ
jgi:hypothetical protein